MRGCCTVGPRIFGANDPPRALEPFLFGKIRLILTDCEEFILKTPVVPFYFKPHPNLNAVRAGRMKKPSTFMILQPRVGRP